MLAFFGLISAHFGDNTDINIFSFAHCLLYAASTHAAGKTPTRERLTNRNKGINMPKYQTEALSAAIRAIRPEATGEQIKAALAELSGEGVREMQGEPPPRAYTRAQVAALIGVSTRTVTQYARRGLLTPLCTGATGKRAQSYTGDSVTALLSGKATKNEKEVTA